MAPNYWDWVYRPEIDFEYWEAKLEWKSKTRKNEPCSMGEDLRRDILTILQEFNRDQSWEDHPNIITLKDFTRRAKKQLKLVRTGFEPG